MGCFQSKKEISDLHPNIFRVVNIDENGVDLCSGQLEITESNIILYREGRDSTVWPLHSLRRYGFEGDLFSFESGRRCETGEGIYAFRCRRASFLFRTLQQQIQLRNVVNDSVPYPVSRITPSPQNRQTLQATVVHRSSVDNGQADPMLNNNMSNTAMPPLPRNPAPRSPSSADILEVMPLYPRSQTNTQATNVYQVRDFKREHNNNQAESGMERHVYTNDLNRDLAMLRKTLRREMALIAIRDIEDETRFLEGRYMENDTDTTKKTSNQASPNKPNNTIKPDNDALSPATSHTSEQYAQLNVEHRGAARLYVNVAPNDNLPLENKNDQPPITPVTPVTPRPVEYCNLTIGSNPEVNTYANLMIGEISDSMKNVKHDHHHKFSESDTFTSMSPVEELEVNYAVLDIDTNKETLKTDVAAASPESQSYNSSKNESTASYSSHARSRMVSQNSIDKSSSTNAVPSLPMASIGYTTIDFDKTVALTSVAAAADANLDACRKSRHNSCIMVSNSSDKK
ncbi:fibroblast growth factor receptor substrate 2 [Zerene cesonia]|uniref:fibroblast growth factor receptor substrate 2 n=1 Tax=Zerene cesonia TaxID=33412 RepID=UPI0018E4DD5B|nr:fibroblast growth factor receptor substrate 2 [Zerene cesonia]